MAIYEVEQTGSDVLRRKSKTVTKIDDVIRELLDDMADTMYHYEGCGLAAPQVGISKRIIVVDVGEELWELINPVLVSGKGKQLGEEGCLSIPGCWGEVERFKSVKVKGLNRYGDEIIIDAKDMGARALLHEIDHLEGILFTDKMKKKK
ncbi:MAG: peptide deformylase [Clostridiales bacterium]